jgi:hypothetical protein
LINGSVDGVVDEAYEASGGEKKVLKELSNSAYSLA